MTPSDKLALLESLAAEGLTQKEAAARLGVSRQMLCQMTKWLGVRLGRSARQSKTAVRTAEIIALFRSGKTAPEIGAVYGLSHQRVQQILKAAGLTRADGGQALMVAADRARRSAEKVARQTEPYSNKKSGLPRGVHRNGRRFAAQVGGHYLGQFDTPAQAHAAYLSAKLDSVQRLCSAIARDADRPSA